MAAKACSEHRSQRAGHSGEPTLRIALRAISLPYAVVRRLSQKGMRPALITIYKFEKDVIRPADFKVRFLEYHWTVNHRKWAYLR